MATSQAIPRTFASAYTLVMGCRAAATLFPGITSKTSVDVRLAQVKQKFRALSMMVHPDKNPAAKVKAEEAFKKLENLRVEADAICRGASPTVKIHDNGVLPQPVVFSTSKHSYSAVRRVAAGATCTVFEGTVQEKKGSTPATNVLIKVPNHHRDNDLMQREAKAFEAMRQQQKKMSKTPEGKEAADKFFARLPQFLGSVEITQPDQQDKKVVNTFIKPDELVDWFSLEQIRKQHPNGVDPKIACFIWNRVLEALTFTHTAGVIHGTITPNHILIRPKDHAGLLIDWTASCLVGQDQPVPYMDAKYACYFPKEIVSGIPNRTSDLFMLAWSIAYVMGADVEKQSLPATVDTSIRALLNKCLQPVIKNRPRTATDVYNEFQLIAKNLWGPRKWVELTMAAA